MTTSITLHVNGRYMAKVKQDDQPWVDVHGNYDGSPNPDGKKVFYLRHATSNKFVVNEEYLGEPELQSIGSKDVAGVKDVGLILDAGKATGGTDE